MMNKLIVAAISLLCTFSVVAQERPSPEQIYSHPKLEVALPNFAADGLILDIGGGGEGIIGQIKGKQVIAIDLIKRELEDAPGNPLLKIVMDARDLKFLDKTLDTVTVFFTFMYISLSDHARVLEEIHRVLKPGGRLLVWDATFPDRKTDEKQQYVRFPLHIAIPGKEINTGYGVRFMEGQGANQLIEAAKKAGFELATRQNEMGWYFLELKKQP